MLKTFNLIQQKMFFDPRSKYIFYKIVNAGRNDEEFYLQCINTNAIFKASLADIVLDYNILKSLHPAQACFIGMEFSKLLKRNYFNNLHQTSKLTNQSLFRYGKYQIQFQDRKGNICFVEQHSNKKFLMDPRDIALSEELISEFDATQSFLVGLYAGLKLINPVNKDKPNKNIFRIIK